MKFDTGQLKRFIFSGGSATFAHLGIMALLIKLGIDPTLSTSVGMVSGAILNYIFQYYYTFNTDAKHHRSILKYLISVCISFVSNLILFMFFYKILKNDALVSQLFTSAFVALQNYWIYKKFVFLRNTL